MRWCRRMSQRPAADYGDYAIGTSAPYTVTVNPTAAGLLAPGYLKIGGVQYVGALFSDWQTFVAPPGAISGYASRRARPGDVIVIYGIGFGR